MSPLPEEMPDRAEESILFHVKQSKTAPKKQSMEDKTMAVTFLTKDNFKREVMQADKPVLIDFYADWCGPCQMMAPVIGQLAGEYEGRVKIGKLNVDENPDIAVQYKVMSIPTMIIFRNGEVFSKEVGASSKKEVEKAIGRAL